MKQIFFWWARLLYGVPNVSQSEPPDLIVPLGYGLTQAGQLPGVEIYVLAYAAFFIPNGETRVAWASSNYFFDGSAAFEDVLKHRYLLACVREGGLGTPVVGSGATNSVTEAEAISLALQKEGVSAPKHILVVCDWAHARSARIIWRHFFPDARISTHSVEGVWEPSHRGKFQRSNVAWFFACVARHVALRVLGVKWVGNFRQPT